MGIINVKGRLGADSELKTLQNGNKFVTMRVAENAYFKGENITNWYRVSWFGDRAVKMQEHMKKGSLVDVWGEFNASLYDTKSGEKGISLDITADRVDFIRGGSGNTQSNDASTDTGTFKKKDDVAVAEAASQEVKNDQVDDLPF